MKRILLALGIVALLGGAFAEGRFVVDDTNFDYFDSDDGYITISYEGDVFTLSFSDSATSDNALEVGDIEFLPLDEDIDYNQASLRRHLPIEVNANSVEITYADAQFGAVITSYDEQLSGLGFSGTVEQAASNSTVMLYEQGDTVARVVFTRQGEDVQVFMSTL